MHDLDTIIARNRAAAERELATSYGKAAIELERERHRSTDRAGLLHWDTDKVRGLRRRLLLLAAALLSLGACREPDNDPPRPVVDPGPPFQGPEVKVFRHVLHAGGAVHGEVIVIRFPQH